MYHPFHHFLTFYSVEKIDFFPIPLNIISKKRHIKHISLALEHHEMQEVIRTSSRAVTELWSRAAGTASLSLTIPFERWSLNIQFHLCALNQQPPPDEEGQSTQKPMKSFFAAQHSHPQHRPDHFSPGHIKIITVSIL